MDSDDRFEAEEEAERAEKQHWEDEMADIEMERRKEEEGIRLMEWKHKAKQFNAPIKVQFT